MTLQELCKIHCFKPSGILHVGASMLEEAQQYKDLGVEMVIWVEALPHTDARSARAAEFGQLLYEGLPLSDRRSLALLRVASNEVSSSILPFNRHSVIYPDIYVKDEIPLEARRADEVFEYSFPREIDTLVLDVQGAELMVLQGMGKLLDQIKWVFAEVNLTPLYTGCALKEQLEPWLKDKGFVHQEFFPVHQSEWGEGLYRKP